MSGLKYCVQKLDQTNQFKDTKIHDKNGVFSLTASTQKNKLPKVLLQAHIDVVAAPVQPICALDPAGQVLTGRGVYDMLFAIACYLTVVEENHTELDKLDFGIMLTGDEELGGFNGVGHLVKQGYGGEICILPDAGEGFGDLSVAAKGAYNFDLVAKGKAHHGSRPWEGDGAANKLIFMIHELMDAFDYSNQHNSTLTVTRFEGGGSINKGPSEASAHIDIRYKDTEDYIRIKSEVDRICKHYGGHIRNLLEAGNVSISTNNKEMKAFIKLYEKHAGHPITFSKAHGGSDARFFVNKGTPVIMIRPDGYGAHGDTETIMLESLAKFYKLIEEFVLKTAKIK